MKSHPAQTNNLPDEQVKLMLAHGLAVFTRILRLLTESDRPSRAAKDQIRRDLAGVIADLETIRLGLA